ncbi:MAG TPA: tetratricopeptide repeat protein [Bryobacteraceae bacterium]|nr:tetratricopeptide repeat protein [Bryobacteraceae bacterium]
MPFLLAPLLAGQPASGTPATFAKNIAPLVYANCTPCHHAGGIGPFPFITYQDVRKHAAQIKAVTERRYMPPWPPQAGYGDFTGARTLTETQIHLIDDWIRAGMPEGDPRDLPPKPQFTSEWQLGPPDLILRMAQPFHMRAGGRDIFRNFVIASGLKETKYVTAFELRLSNPRVVHHANVVLDRTQSLRRRDGEDGSPGFPGMDVTTEAAPNEFDPDSHFLFWKPGSVLMREPPEMSWRLDPKTDLILNLHLQPTGKDEVVQAEIGLYFSSHPPTKFPMLLQLEHDGAIDIPPGDRSFTVVDELTLPVGVDVLAIYPHAHYLGKLIECWATLPNGGRKWLIRIPDWDINWQAVYEYRQPIALPSGTKISMRITYDNSATNPRNPSNPPKEVKTGDLSTDEMGHVWLQVLPHSGNSNAVDPRMALQEAVMLRRVQKYPADFVAHYNLGAIYQQQDKLAEAIDCYRDALRVEPGNATVHNSLGSALLAEDKIPEAIGEFRETLRMDRDYDSARFNLAHALAATGDLNGAADEFNELLKRDPNDAGAQADLGTVYFKLHNYQDALVHLQASITLRSDDADVLTNYGTVLAIMGRFREAIKAFQQALTIDPNHEAARANLNQAKANLATGH